MWLNYYTKGFSMDIVFNVKKSTLVAVGKDRDKAIA